MGHGASHLNRILFISWYDPTASPETWTDEEEFLCQEPAVCNTVGLVVKENEEAIWVASSWTDDGSVGEGIIIPKGCLISVDALTA